MIQHKLLLCSSCKKRQYSKLFTIKFSPNVIVCGRLLGELLFQSIQCIFTLRDTLKSSILGGLALKSHNLILLYTILTEKVSLSYTFNSKRVPLAYYNTFITGLWIWINHQKSKSSHHFHVLPNKWNGATIRCISLKLLITDWEISLPFHIPQPAKSLPPFTYLEPENGTNFEQSLPWLAIIGSIPPPMEFHLQW